MQFTIASLFAAVAMAGPLAARNDNYSCSVAGVIDGQPQCCAVNVLGLLALDCQNRKISPPFSRCMTAGMALTHPSQVRQRQLLPVRRWPEGRLRHPPRCKY